MDSTTNEREEAASDRSSKPTRTGACPFCLRKHLLKVRGYAREVEEDPSREWEREKFMENLLLAEDHSIALGNKSLATAIRLIRHDAEDGFVSSVSAEKLYDDFKIAYADDLARAREKILESQRGVGVENKAEPAPSEEQ